MGLFRSKSDESIPIRAATGYGRVPGSVSVYSSGVGSARALSIPTVARAVGLITSTIAGLELRTYSLNWDPELEEYSRIYQPNESWMERPTPNTTRQFVIASTVRELMFYGRSYWYTTGRYRTGYPSSFQWLPYGSISTPDQSGPEWFGPSSDILFNGQEIDPANVVQFLSPIPGMLDYGQRAIDIAIALDNAAKRFSTVDIPAGYLQVKPGGEALSPSELEEIASGWAAARRENSVGILNELLEYHSSNVDPSTLQLAEARNHAALELARVMQVPPWLVGLAVGGMTYDNSQSSRKDLYLFGAKPFVDAIEQTLSGPDVLPRGRYVELDVVRYIYEAELPAPVPVEPTIGVNP